MTDPAAPADPPSRARRLLDWIEPAVLWGLGAWILREYVRARRADVDAPGAWAVLCVTAYLSEFFLLHAGMLLGTVIQSRGRGILSGIRTWGCGALLLAGYALFVIPGAIALGLGGLGATVVLGQMLRTALAMSKLGPRETGERAVVGMLILALPFATGLPVASLLSAWMGPMEGRMGSNIAILWLGAFYFGWSGFFASPLYAALRDRIRRPAAPLSRRPPPGGRAGP